MLPRQQRHAYTPPADDLRPWDEVARLFRERNPGQRMDAHWARAIHYKAVKKLRAKVVEIGQLIGDE